MKLRDQVNNFTCLQIDFQSHFNSLGRFDDRKYCCYVQTDVGCLYRLSHGLANDNNSPAMFVPAQHRITVQIDRSLLLCADVLVLVWLLLNEMRQCCVKLVFRRILTLQIKQWLKKNLLSFNLIASMDISIYMFPYAVRYVQL